MTDQPGHTTITSSLLQRLAAGDPAANEELIAHSMERLRRLARGMLRENPSVRRQNQTDDVLQNSLLRLHRALESVKPESPRAFIGLAATQIRRELIDLYHHTRRQKRGGKVKVFDIDQRNAEGEVHFDLELDTLPVDKKVALTQAIEALEPELREVVDLIATQNLTQETAAEIVGVSTKTIKRRWREAKLKLSDLLGSDFASDG